ncbi:hypothetical protein FGO68_gene2001 [Halteria grandinella]|uniref:SKP1 component dimerisation domain-containing protein n=1 Tax=Halteria grandinella TaxID=5974 RepID=A0A8J8SZ64_HALGN|nr:hypothetical protein FGO68_gene2001 [Halteria grandinella]
METEGAKFITNDGFSVKIRLPIAMMMQTYKDMIESGADLTTELPLEDISKVTLDRVVQFLEHLELGNEFPQIEKPLRSNDMKDVTTEWLANFIDLDDDSVQDLILAADFLNIPNLLSLSCAKMGSVIRGLTIPEFRKRFNIVNDFTPEEEAEPFDEARLAQLAEEYEREQEEKATQEATDQAENEEIEKQEQVRKRPRHT